MRYIINYNNFNESKGISDSCENILYKIWDLIENNITNFKSSNLKFEINETDFICKDVILNYNISMCEENICKGQTIVKDSIIDNGYLINSIINIDILVKNLDDEFIYYIKSVLFHELLHLFQHYNILIGNKFRPEFFSIGSILPQLRNIIKTNYGNYILDILYYSLSNELSAQIHQYYFHKKNDKNYDKIIEIRNLLYDFKIRKLNESEYKEIETIKKHILNSIKYYTNNKYYKKNIEKSLWNKDVELFIEDLSNLLKEKVKWIDKKIKLIDVKLEELNESSIRYDLTISLPSNWDEHELIDKLEIYNFVKQNFNDCPIIDNI